MTVARQGRRAASGGAGGVISNGSATNFNCDSFTGWTDDDAGEGISSLSTFGGRSTFDMDGGLTYAANNGAVRSKVLSTTADLQRKVVSYIVYPVAELDIAGLSVFGALNLNFYLGAGLGFCPLVIFADGIASYDGGYYAVATGLSLIGAWQTITVDITYAGGIGTFDLWLGASLVASGLPITLVASSTSGRTDIAQYSRLDDSPIYIPKTSHVDQILVGDDFA